MRHMALTISLRSKYHSSIHMYIAVSHALERYTGSPLGAFMKQRILELLGMSDTDFGGNEAKQYAPSAELIVQVYD